MSFCVLADFTGDVNVSQSRYGNADLLSIIETTEKKILKDLLGEDLYAKVIAAPTTSPYSLLVSGTTYHVLNQDDISVNIVYEGIKPMLKYFCYAEILKRQQNENTSVGQVEPNQDNSNRMPKNNLNTLISQAYNKGLDLYGYDIDNYAANDSFIRGKRYQDLKVISEYDYYQKFLRASCYNYLSYEATNHPSYFETWIFTIKNISGFSGWL
jgi:hypothetical protein